MRRELRRWFVALCLLLAAGSLLAQEQVRIGILAYRPRPQAMAQWAPLAAALNRAIPEYEFSIETYGYDEIQSAVAARQVNFVLLNPGDYVVLDHLYNLSAPLVTLVNEEQGKPVSSFGGVIFRLANRVDIRKLEDMRGKTVAAASTSSLGGYQAQAYELFHAGLRMPRDMRLMTTGMPHDNVVNAVLSGRADIGFVRSGVLESLAREGKLDLRRITILNKQNMPDFPAQLSTRLYPEWPFAAMPHTNKELQREVVSFLLKLDDNSIVTRALKIHGFDVPADYTPVEQLLREMRMPPFEAAPEFTTQDIWNRNRAEIAGILAGIALIVLMAVWLLFANRRLDAEQRTIMLQQQQLQESEFRWKFALEGAGEGVWDWNIQAGKTLFSKRWKEMIGYAEDEFGDGHDEWERAIHPDDKAKVMATLQDYLDGKSQTYHVEFRLRCKDGSWKWILARGMVVSRSEDGKPLRMIGTQEDIGRRKHDEQALLRENQKNRALLRSASDGIHILDMEGNLIEASDSFCRQLGFQHEEMQGMNVSQWDSHFDAGNLSSIIKEQYESGDRSQFETLHRRKDGTTFDVEISGHPVLLDGRPVMFYSARDITGRKKTEEELKLADSVFQNSSEAMMVTDAEGVIITVNPAFAKLTGYTAQDVIGQNTSILNSGYHDQAFFQTMWQELLTNGHWQGEVRNRRKSGECFDEWLTINAIRNPNGSIHRFVALFSDITEKKKSEELIWQQANFDSLTGLPNRRMLFNRLEQEIKISNRGSLPLAVLFIDLDRFKEVNDSLGHEFGDILLKEAAARMLSCVRESDTVGRMGGDEFTVILGNLEDAGSAGRIAKKLLLKLAEPFQLGADTAYVSASIGITVYPDDAADVSTLLKNADQAMYEAKRQGRNRFHFYTPAMQTSSDARMQLTNNLHAAIEENQFVVYYQPIVELSTGSIHKAEALIRWQHPRLGLISPADFIPVAEETGMINEIGDWVFRQAVAYALHLRGNCHPDFQISVNKSPVQFTCDSQTHVAWFDHLKQIGLPAQSIVIEITESLLMETNVEIGNQLLAFRDQGMQVALDDFGTGYSSLSYLKKLHIDYLKIDQSFIRNLAKGSSDFALCEAMVVMAHKLELKVIAEGVETEEQRDLLKQIGCDYAQGFLFSRPVSAGEFEKLLKIGNLPSMSKLGPAALWQEAGV